MNTRTKNHCANLIAMLLLIGGGIVGCTAENTILGEEGNGGGQTDAETDDGSPLPDGDTDPGDVPETDNGAPDGDGGPVGECDLSGIWAVRVWTISEALKAAACSNNWYYYEIEDTGDEFTITRGASCAFEVYGSATVLLEESARRGFLERSEPSLIAANPDIPDTRNNSLVGRGGTYKPDGNGGCEMTLDRWWTVRGANLETYLPARENYSTETIASMQNKVPLPTEDNPDGAEDWDEDGIPAITLYATKPVEGYRAAIQRDWNAVGENAPQTIRSASGDVITAAQGTNEFSVRMVFDNNEELLDYDQAILNQVSQVAPSTDQLGHVMTWKRLSEPMPSGAENIDEMLNYCVMNVQRNLDTRSYALLGRGSTKSCCTLPERVNERFPAECLFPE